MAKLDRYKQALVNADKAGDVDAARKIATKIRELQAQPQQASPSLLNKAAEFVRGPGQALAQGATFGFYDELRGLADQALGGDYEAGVEQARGEAKGYRKENPILSPVLEVGGGLTTAIPAGIAGSGTRLGQAAISNIPSLLRYGAGGAAGGALAGAGYSEEGERATGATKGAVAGGALGVGLPVAGRLAGAGVQGLGWLSGAARAPRSRASRKLAQALRRDSLTPEQVQARMRKMGPQATIADAGGENVLGLAEVSGQMPGQARNRAVAMLNRRQTGQQGRVMDALTDTLGDESDFYQTLKRIGQEKRANAAPLYKQAYDVDVPYTDKLQDLTKRPSVQKAMRNALKQAADEGEDIAPAFRIKNGEVEGLEQPSMKTWDYVKRGLDEVIESNTDEFGKVNAAGRRAANIKREMLDELDEINPTYKQARQVFADDAANESALKMGRQFIRKDAEITQDALNKMSEAEREYFRAGAIRAIRDKIEAAADTNDAYKRIFNNPGIRKKLESLFPDKRSFAQFARQMQNESAFYRTRGTVTGNSATARRLAQQSDLNVDSEFMSGAVLSPEYALARTGLRSLQNRMGIPEDVAEELAPMLFSQDAATQQKALSAALRATRPSRAGEILRQAAPGATVTGAAQGQRLTP